MALTSAALVAAVAPGATPAAGSAPLAAPEPSPDTAAVGAAAAGTAVLAQPSPDLPGLPDLSLELNEIAVDSAEFRTARAAYDEVDAALAERQAARVGIDLGTTRTRAVRADREAALAGARARAASLQSRLDQVDGAIGDLALRMFVTGNGVDRVASALVEEQPSISELDERHVLAGASLDVLLAEQAAYRARLAEVEATIDEAEADLAALDGQHEDLLTGRSGARQAEVSAAEPVAERRVELENARVLAKVDGVEFALVALDAYYRAANTMAVDQPSCGIRWWGIAGVSRVEGRHGTYGGAKLDAHGNPNKRIVGIQLNGTNQTRVIGDTDGGALDGDAAFDRAVGPMQFIPSTWRRWKADGNGDGNEDPFNLYDATLAAARYLCHSRTGLDHDDGLRAAYLSYNHSLAYVENVLGHARLYAASLDVPDPIRP